MKTLGTFLRHLRLAGILCLLALSLSPVSSIAAEKDRKPTASEKEDLEALKAFMELPPEKLAEIRVSIEAIEKMSPGERKRLLHRLQEYQKQPAAERQKTLKRFNQLSPEERRAYFEYMKGMNASQKAAFRKLPWEEQLKAIRANAKKKD